MIVQLGDLPIPPVHSAGVGYPLSYGILTHLSIYCR